MAGIAGLFISLLLLSALAPLFAGLVISGFAAAGAHVVWMLNHRRTPSPGMRRPIFAMGHIAAAGVRLLCACVFGVVLTAAPMTDMTLRAALAYGVFGLVGFLAQIIVGFEAHVLPTVAAYWSHPRGGGTKPVHNRLERMGIYYAWLAGGPALAAGLFFNAPVVLAAGAWVLFGATVVSAIGTTRLIFSGRAGSSGLPSRASRSTIRVRQGGHQ